MAMDSTPKAGSARTPINFRLSDNVIADYDAMSHAYSEPGVHVTRTDVIKAHLAVAARHTDEVRTTLARIVEARR